MSEFTSEALRAAAAIGPLTLHPDGLRWLADRLDDLEVERIRLAACGVAAQCNTVVSAMRHRLDADSPFRSGSYDEVCAAADREIAFREALEYHRWIVDDIRAWLKRGAVIRARTEKVPDESGQLVERPIARVLELEPDWQSKLPQDGWYGGIEMRIVAQWKPGAPQTEGDAT